MSLTETIKYNNYTLTKYFLQGDLREYEDEVENIGSYAFFSCTSLQSVNFPNCNTIGEFAFDNCISLQSVSFPNCSTIENFAFASCTSLQSVYLLSTSVCTLSNSNAFWLTPISRSSYLGYYGSIYVPSSLLTAYQAATNWTYYSNRFVGV